MNAFYTLEELVTENLEEIKAGKERPYLVTHGDSSHFVLAKSKGQAALEVCTVLSVQQKDIQKAALNALLLQQKEQQKEQKKNGD